MIISDATAVNTGHRNGVVARLQRQLQQKGQDEPQFIGCQHHTLDLVLWHLLDFCSQQNYGHLTSGLLIAVAPRYRYCSGAIFTVALAPLLLAESSGDSSVATFLAAFSAIRYRYFF